MKLCTVSSLVLLSTLGLYVNVVKVPFGTDECENVGQNFGREVEEVRRGFVWHVVARRRPKSQVWWEFTKPLEHGAQAKCSEILLW